MVKGSAKMVKKFAANLKSFFSFLSFFKKGWGKKFLKMFRDYSLHKYANKVPKREKMKFFFHDIVHSFLPLGFAIFYRFFFFFALHPRSGKKRKKNQSKKMQTKKDKVLCAASLLCFANHFVEGGQRPGECPGGEKV
jgi:hypothetical protein